MALASLLVGLAAAAASAPATPARGSLAELRVEYKADPIGIDAPRPRLSWKLRSDGRGIAQSAYRIQVVPDAPAFRDTVAFWDTGRVASDRSVHVPYGGPALESSRRQDGAAVVVEVGSGIYAFAYPAAGLTLPGPSLPATQP